MISFELGSLSSIIVLVSCPRFGPVCWVDHPERLFHVRYRTAFELFVPHTASASLEDPSKATATLGKTFPAAAFVNNCCAPHAAPSQILTQISSGEGVRTPKAIMSLEGSEPRVSHFGVRVAP